MFSLASDSGHILLDFQRSVLDMELRMLCNRFFLFMFQFLPHQTHCITSDIITLQISSNKCNFEMVNCLRLFSILGQNKISISIKAATFYLTLNINLNNICSGSNLHVLPQQITQTNYHNYVSVR